jgi:hypothetical protein
MKKPKPGAKATIVSARWIKELLQGGITVTIGGVPIQICLGPVAAAAGAAVAAAGAKPSVAGARARARRAGRAAAGPAPRRPRRIRRRRSRRVILPDGRDVRGFLATRTEGGTLSAVASQFKVKRPLMKKLLTRLLARKEIVLFKGAFYNNKRLRQRRLATKMFATPGIPAPAAAAAERPPPPAAEREPDAPVPVVASPPGTDPSNPTGPA